MLDKEKAGAANLNRINNILPEHIIWIKDQIKKGSFIITRGREVLIAVPGKNLKHIVNIPGKEDPAYKRAWVSVYNLALDYLEGSLNLACMENKFIKHTGSGWSVNNHLIVWPTFNSQNADYARGLENILNEYNYVKEKYNTLIKNQTAGVNVKKSSVMLKPATEVTIAPKDIPVVPEKQTVEVHQATVSEFKPQASQDKDLVIQKISDGDVLNNRDINELRESKPDLVILTCQNTLEPKEEDVFLKNESKCQSENFNTGAFIYGNATEQREGALELKRMLKMFDKCGNNFSKFVIYSINNDYVKKNKNGDIKLLEFINTYNAILDALTQSGYNVMLSMNLESAEVINDINRRYNMQNEFEVSYMVVVRDMELVPKDASVIVVDPWNDYDVVTIKDTKTLDIISRSIEKNSRSLAKAA